MRMKLLACGNPALSLDNLAFAVADALADDLADAGVGVERITDPLQLLEHDLADCVLLDVAYGITEPALLTDVDRLKLSRLVSLHDFDVAYFLKLLKELGKLDALRIIALPVEMPLEAARPAVQRLLPSARHKL